MNKRTNKRESKWAVVFGFLALAIVSGVVTWRLAKIKSQPPKPVAADSVHEEVKVEPDAKLAKNLIRPSDKAEPDAKLPAKADEESKKTVVAGPDLLNHEKEYFAIVEGIHVYLPSQPLPTEKYTKPPWMLRVRNESGHAVTPRFQRLDDNGDIIDESHVFGMGPGAWLFMPWGDLMNYNWKLVVSHEYGGPETTITQSDLKQVKEKGSEHAERNGTSSE